MPRHSHQDALNDSEYERLLDAAQELKPPYSAECLLILICGGRLGMRAGEISHMQEWWIDWERKLIEIPRYSDCECGYCRKQARQRIEHAEEDMTLEEAMEERWNPKTSNSARSIPFDFDPFVESVITAFFDVHDEYPKSRVSINRRVNRVVEEAGMGDKRIYPHCLRATAGTYHAYRGLPAAPLQSLFGWADLATAQKYLRLSGGATAKALKEVHQ